MNPVNLFKKILYPIKNLFLSMAELTISQIFLRYGKAIIFLSVFSISYSGLLKVILFKIFFILYFILLKLNLLGNYYPTIY